MERLWLRFLTAKKVRGFDFDDVITIVLLYGKRVRRDFRQADRGIS